jgi:hypothetical protein
MAAKKFSKTHCKKGHEFTPENSYINPKGDRVCRECKRLRNQGNVDRYAQLKAAGLCVLCGKNPATLAKVGSERPAKFNKYCETCKNNYNLNRSATRLRAKEEVLAHYGPAEKLQCCWEGCTVIDPDMLTIDHIDNTGSSDRKGSYKGGVSFYMKLKRDGYPEGFQTLCHNHQWKKEILRRRADINGTPTWRK